MGNKKKLALKIGIAGVIIYLLLNRYRKKKAIEKAKSGADVEAGTQAKVGADVKADATPTSTNTNPTFQSGECGVAPNKPTGSQGKVEQTISIVASNANFSGGNSKSVKAQYFR